MVIRKLEKTIIHEVRKTELYHQLYIEVQGGEGRHNELLKFLSLFKVRPDDW